MLTLRAWILIFTFYQVFTGRLPSADSCWVVSPSFGGYTIGYVPCNVAVWDAYFWAFTYVGLLLTGCWQVHFSRWIMSAALPVGFTICHWSDPEAIPAVLDPLAGLLGGGMSASQIYLLFRPLYFFISNVPFCWFISLTYKFSSARFTIDRWKGLLYPLFFWYFHTSGEGLSSASTYDDIRSDSFFSLGRDGVPRSKACLANHDLLPGLARLDGDGLEFTRAV